MAYYKDYFNHDNPIDYTNLDYTNGYDFTENTVDEVDNLYKKVLNEGIHGICYSLYAEGQKPGDIITEDQVRRRMQIIAPYIKWIRSFSCTEGNEFIPKVAKEYGIKTLVGAWIGDDAEKNKNEIEGLLKLAEQGYVDIAAVGNEVMYRKEMSEEDLIKLISDVKSKIPNHIPVGYVDAYYEFTIKPKLTEVCDVILSNCYPFWEGSDIDYSLAHMKSMYYQALEAGQGKKVIITETGWPSQGESFKGSVPTELNFQKYFINTQIWTKQMGIDTFYFASFDESWKKGPEGEVGAHWGIWDKKEQLKF